MVAVKGQGKGNQCARKLTTQELKQQAYKQYCDHIGNGRPQKSWYFEHPELTICYKTMENYIKEDPNNFPPIQKEVGYAKSLDIWFDKGKDMMDSEKRCNPAIYQMIMRNIHGWDKESVEEKIDKEKQERTLLEKLVEGMTKPKEAK